MVRVRSQRLLAQGSLDLTVLGGRAVVHRLRINPRSAHASPIRRIAKARRVAASLDAARSSETLTDSSP